MDSDEHEQLGFPLNGLNAKSPIHFSLGQIE